MKILACVLFAGLLASGCTIKPIQPEPLSLSQLEEKSKQRLESYNADQEAVNGPISLYDAMARAIKYNLDYKVELFEEALRGSEANMARMDM